MNAISCRAEADHHVTRAAILVNPPARHAYAQDLRSKVPESSAMTHRRSDAFNGDKLFAGHADMHRKIASLLLLCAVTSLAQTNLNSTTPAQPPHPNFSGTWKLNMARSRFSQSPGSHRLAVPERSETDVIDHEESTLMITPHIDRRDVVTPLLCRIGRKDGPQGPYADTQKRCDAHWEGTAYIFDTRSKAPEATSETTALELSPDGKTLTKRVHVTWPDGSTDLVFVYDKFSDARGSIVPGDTLDRVKHQWGEPEKVVEEGRQTILIYGAIDKVFIDGKMINSVGGTGIGDKPPVFPPNVAIGQTKDQVLKVYGQPANVAKLNEREFDFYQRVAIAYAEEKVVFINATGETKSEVLAVFGEPSRAVQWNGKEFDFYPFMTATYFDEKLIDIGPSAY